MNIFKKIFCFRVDPETGKLFFKLDANNLVDSKGESVQMKAKFFQDGYVEGNKASGDFDIRSSASTGM